MSVGWASRGFDRYRPFYNDSDLPCYFLAMLAKQHSHPKCNAAIDVNYLNRRNMHYGAVSKAQQ